MCIKIVLYCLSRTLRLWNIGAMMQFRALKLFIFLACFLGGVFLLPADIALAQVDTGIEFAEATGLSDTDPRVVVANVIRVVLGFLGIIAVILVIYAGFVMMTSEGDSTRTQKAKDVLKAAVIGLIIVLSSYAIASFVINMFLGATGGGSGQSEQQQRQEYIGGGSGVIGAGIVSSVYPEPFATDVPRNTSIMVTFKEEIDESTIICAEVDIDLGCGAVGEMTNNIRLFQKDAVCADGECVIQEIREAGYVKAKALTKNSKTFVLIPLEPIGSENEELDYMVYMDDGISKKNGDAAFSAFSVDDRSWEFNVSSVIDLTPPKVISVFPPPDNEKDEVVESGVSEVARGSIEVGVGVNAMEEAGIVSFETTSGLGGYDLRGDYSCSDGSFGVSVGGDFKSVVGEDGSGFAGQRPSPILGGDDTGDGKIDLGCGLSIVSGSGFGAGDSWDIQVKGSKAADSLTIGGERYVFVASGEGGGNAIEVSDDLEVLAGNIASVIDGNELIEANSVRTVIGIAAATAGEEGSGIGIEVSDGEALKVTQMVGGSSVSERREVKGVADQLKNSLIQITFDEAINPTSVVGTSEDLKDIIRVVDGSGNVVDGEFVVSNGFKTVEFVSRELCGVNGCGEEIYCLPGGEELSVELVAAGLISCDDDTGCSDKGGYGTCSAFGVCENAGGINYPVSDIVANISGIMDAANNSMDGNGDGEAVGPVSFFDENHKESRDGGDSFKWSFFTVDEVDLTSPVVLWQSVNHGGKVVEGDFGEPVVIEFSKVMQSSSLVTGARFAGEGADRVEHRLVNLENLSGQSTGYWITNEGVDTDDDGYPNKTKGLINHTSFRPANLFKGQIGSGVRDIYQNCFKPCQGPRNVCGDMDDEKPSWCSGEKSVLVCE